MGYWGRTFPRVPPASRTSLLELTDVLFGRGNAVSHHPGNWLFRQAMALNQDYYLSLCKEEKTIAGESLLLYLRLATGASFLEPGDQPEMYNEVSWSRVMEKIKQSLREKGCVSSGISPSVKRILEERKRGKKPAVGNILTKAAASYVRVHGKHNDRGGGVSPSKRKYTRTTTKKTPAKKKQKVKTKEEAVKKAPAKKPQPKKVNAKPFGQRMPSTSTPAEPVNGVKANQSPPFQQRQFATNFTLNQVPAGNNGRPSPAMYNAFQNPPSNMLLPMQAQMARIIQEAHAVLVPIAPRQPKQIKLMATRRTPFPRLLPLVRNTIITPSNAAKPVSPSISTDQTAPMSPLPTSPSRPPSENKRLPTKELQKQAKVHAEELQAFRESFLNCKRYAEDTIKNHLHSVVEQYPVDEHAEDLVRILRPIKLRKVNTGRRVLPMPVFYQDDDNGSYCPQLIKRI
eukprot:scaffold6899_cov183-Amphora_coffeaeformis.AAC.52